MINLQNLDSSEPQAVFDFIYTHLKTQKAVSEDKTGSCLYKGDNGLKCAAGCLIGDSEYIKSIEHQSWPEVAEFFSIQRHTNMISEFQLIHDGVNYPNGDWVGEVKSLAIRNHLTFTE
ncbi:hypothetical protein [Pseudomonas phage Astolliot]|nr:hypothetical protein [Pseudomonas phage Astolliot]